jgi:hypothetical protein
MMIRTQAESAAIMSKEEELRDLSKSLSLAAHTDNMEPIDEPFRRLEEAARNVAASFSGSWLGYHANVYYSGFQAPPAGAHFSQEWGLCGEEWLGLGSTGDWNEFNPSAVKQIIIDQAGNPELTRQLQASKEAERAFMNARSQFLSILETEKGREQDSVLADLKKEFMALSIVSKYGVLDHFRPRGTFTSRDAIAIGQGTKTPAHIDVLADVTAIRHALGTCKLAAEICSKAASHLDRKKRMGIKVAQNRDRIFIGHGRSAQWRELKDFLGERLGLQPDEFNRTPVAGLSTTERLTEMLDSALFAFVIMTAEDQIIEGEM